MKRFLKSSIKFLAYAAFFLAVLVLFVYMTLPLEEARAFLVRKASDEYNADLVFSEEEPVSVCGLACVEAQNVTLTFRPSAEELAAFQEAQRAWKEWKADEASAKEDADGDAKADAKA
ncbi:MAG: hypothetical protein KC549_01430, partial [Myxococcales bacterium]|nr:hypothetical protein [Myxococcales bacterium]